MMDVDRTKETSGKDLV